MVPTQVSSLVGGKRETHGGGLMGESHFCRVCQAGYAHPLVSQRVGPPLLSIIQNSLWMGEGRRDEHQASRLRVTSPGRALSVE